MGVIKMNERFSRVSGRGYGCHILMAFFHLLLCYESNDAVYKSHTRAEDKTMRHFHHNFPVLRMPDQECIGFRSRSFTDLQEARAM